MPIKGVPQPVEACAILLRNSQPEKAHGKPGQALPLPPLRKEFPPVRPLPNITFQAELLRYSKVSSNADRFLLPLHTQIDFPNIIYSKSIQVPPSFRYHIY